MSLRTMRQGIARLMLRKHGRAEAMKRCKKSIQQQHHRIEVALKEGMCPYEGIKLCPSDVKGAERTIGMWTEVIENLNQLNMYGESGMGKTSDMGISIDWRETT